MHYLRLPLVAAPNGMRPQEVVMARRVSSHRLVRSPSHGGRLGSRSLSRKSRQALRYSSEMAVHTFSTTSTTSTARA